MKVTSKKELYFPKFNFGIKKGEVRDLPEDKEAQKVILAHNSISELGTGSVQSSPKGETK